MDKKMTHPFILKLEQFKLTFHSPTGLVPAVCGVDLSMRSGEILALVGESGCGKTALCRSILRLHSRHAVIDPESRLFLCGRDVTRLSDQEMEQIRGRDAAMIFQDPMTSLDPVWTAGAQIREALQYHTENAAAEDQTMQRQVMRLLAELELDSSIASRYPYQLSGGERQRVVIAMALACDPALLIADEPTTSLDPETQNHLLNLLQSLCRRHRKAMLFVTHDLSMAERIADRIAVMQDGRILEEGTTEQIFHAPRQEYTKALIRYAQIGKGQTGCDHHCFDTDQKSVEFSPDSPAIVRVTHLFKSFGARHQNQVLEDINLELHQGEVLGIAGRSGIGKTTLAKCMMGIETPDTGTISILPGCRIHMIFQDSAAALQPAMNIQSIIEEPLILSPCRMPRKERFRRVREAAKRVYLPEELLDRHPYDLSGGQRQRVAMARALIVQPDVLIADEPIASLDLPVQVQIVHLLKELQEEMHLTVIMITHDLQMLRQISDRIIKI